MWKWSVITDEVSQEIEVAAEFAVRHGLSGLEIRSAFGNGFYDITDAQVERILRAVKASGLAVCAVAPPFFKCAVTDDAAVAVHMDGLRRAVEVAGALHAKIVRGFGFFREGHADIPWDLILRRFEPVIPILEDAGLTLAIENDPSLFTPDGRTLAQLVRRIGSPCVAALWDPGNVPFSYSDEAPFPEGYEAVRGLVQHMHVKDAHPNCEGARAVAVGQGVVDYRAQFAALMQDHYEGYISLETHYRLSRELAEKELLLPAGYDFSDGGYASSSHALRQMQAALKDWGMPQLYAGANG